MAEETKKDEKPKSIIEVMQEKIAELEARLATVEKRPYAKRQLFGGKTERNPIVDTKTGKIYISKSALGKNLAAEFSLDPADKFVWYKIRAKAPDRFREATEEESAKVLKEYEDQIAAEQAALEAAEKAKAQGQAPAAGKKAGGKKG